MILAEHHEKMLIDESGIARDVAEARGYCTIEKKVELKSLGFSDSQCNRPGLLIPIYSPTGEVVNYQYRPDQPRIRDGKHVKYETPRGSRMTLDVHPAVREMLGNPLIPLFLTEGVKKGVALVSCDRCAIATHSMRERAEELGGRCTIEALPLRGTLVSAQLPCWTARDTHHQEE